MTVTLATRRGIASFFRSDRASIAPIFGLSVVPLMGLMGAGLDYCGAANMRTSLQAALDATILATAHETSSKSDAELETYAKGYFAGLAPDDTAQIDSVAVSTGRTEITIAASATYVPQFINIFGDSTIPLKAEAKTIMTNATYEIALVLDNSGSMASGAGSATKIAAARDAANSLVATMMTTTTAIGKTKISIVPFTLSVKLGNSYAGSGWLDLNGLSSIHWNNTNYASSSWKPTSKFELFSELGIGWGGCVESRPGNWGLTDDPPSSSAGDSLFVPQFAPDEPGNAGYSTYSFSTGGYNTTWSYANSYINDNPATCTAGDVTTTADYSAAQTKLCKYRSRPAINTSSNRGPNYNCDARPLQRLTSVQTTLKASIDAMVAGGNTNLLEGFTWGWRTLSPNLPFADGVPYDTRDNNKIIILMTDGMNAWNSANNHNKSVYSPFGYYGNDRLGTGATSASQARAQLDAKTLAACTLAKAQGITIYTVGFSVPTDPIDTNGRLLLSQCATSTRMAYMAENASQIVAVFDEIAKNISKLRLAQ